MTTPAASAAPETAAARDWRKDFHDFEEVIYLNLAGMSPIPRVAARALETAADWRKLPNKLPDEAFFGLPNRVRELLARLLGGKPEEFALTSGASGGIAAVAHGLEWKPEDEVIIAQGEFPAHFSTWMPLHHAGRLRVKIVEPAGRFLTTEDLVAAIGPRTRVVSTSHVRFDNGARIEASRMAEAVHRVGGYLLLDASQSAGAVPMDVEATGADFVVASGYKWLLSPFGTGFFWIRQEHIDRMRPGPFYWMALEGAENFHSLTKRDAKHTPVAGHARRWDAAETSNFFNLAVMEASVGYVLSAGVETVRNHNARLIAQMIERLPVDRCILASPREAERRGPYACVALRTPEKTRSMFEKLCGEKIYVSLRENALRVAPYLYNTERDIERLIRVLSI